MRARRTSTVVAVLAALAVGQVITSRVDVVSADNPPFLRDGDVGDVVGLSYADVEVTDVRPAQYLAPAVSTELARKASGVWVVVSVKATATREPTLLLSAWLVDREGRLFRTSAKSDCGRLLETATAVPAYAMFCFDVPPEVLAGLRFRLARGDVDTDRTDGDDVADVDLGVSSEDERSWARTTDAYGVVLPGFAPFELEEITLDGVPS